MYVENVLRTEETMIFYGEQLHNESVKRTDVH